MIAASYSLAFEGASYTDNDASSVTTDTADSYYSLYCTVIGAAAGVAFILVTKSFLDQYEHLKLEGIDRASAQKMILIIFVMTLHSLTEGIGIGVSFGGSSGTLIVNMYIYTFIYMHTFI